jgi:anaerobic selenocysteine-containing dehydrogenase
VSDGSGRPRRRSGRRVPHTVGPRPLLHPGRPTLDAPDGTFTVATRRGKQFNSMVFDDHDPVTGADRDDVFIDPADAHELGFLEGDTVTLRSETGTYTGRLRYARLPRRSLQVHWPEGNVLIAVGPEHREAASRVPDYNATVTLVPADA